MEGKTKTAVEKGRRAEDIAAAWLSARGLRILERNFRLNHLEVDIIAEGPMLSPENAPPSSKARRFIHIVEVRSRAENSPVAPELTIGDKKRKHLINAADAYVRSRHISLDVVFDIMGIEKTASGERIVFVPDAFRPHW